jgi:hypothetical protein
MRVSTARRNAEAVMGRGYSLSGYKLKWPTDNHQAGVLPSAGSPKEDWFAAIWQIKHRPDSRIRYLITLANQ